MMRAALTISETHKERQKSKQAKDQQKNEDKSSHWSFGLRRLHRALSISSKKKRFSYEEALNRALTQVRENEDVTEEVLLDKILRDDTSKKDSPPLSKASSILRVWSTKTDDSRLLRQDAFLRRRSNAIDHDQPPTVVDETRPTSPPTEPTESEFDNENKLTEEDEKEEEEDEDKDEENEEESEGDQSATEDTEAFHKLEVVAKALADGGRSGLDTLRGALEQENLQTGLDKLFNHILHTFQDQWSQLFEFLVPWQQMQAMLLICCLQLININQFLKFVPICSCCLAFFAMIYCTLKLYHSRYWTKKAKVWRRLLNVFQFSSQVAKGDNRNQSIMEKSETTNREQTNATREPYGNFFLALALFIFSFALTDRKMMPNVFPLCALCIFFAFTCLIVLIDRSHNFWAKLIMFLDLFSVLPFIVERLFSWRLYSIFDNLIKLRVGALKFGLGLSSISVLSIFGLYTYLWLANAKNGPNQSLSAIVPHLVCFFWWHTGLELFITCDSSFEWRHALLTTVIIWLILFPTWTAGSCCFVVAIVQMKDFFSATNLLKCVSIILVFCLPYAYKRLMTFMDEQGASEWTKFFRTWIQQRQNKVILIYLSLLILSTAILYGGRESPEVLKRKTSNLTWSEFHQHCSSFESDLKEDQYRGNLLLRQIACSEFGSTVVEWSGVVETIRIINIENFLDSIFFYLPDIVAQRLRCLYGQKTDAFNGTTSTRKQCSVAQYNVYTFEIEVNGPWILEQAAIDQQSIDQQSVDQIDRGRIGPGVAIIEASDMFETITLDLRRGDIINFTAILDDDILNYPPRLDLLQIECLKCPGVFENRHTSRVVAEAFYSEDHWFWNKLYNACRYVFNFACAPLLAIE